MTTVLKACKPRLAFGMAAFGIGAHPFQLFFHGFLAGRIPVFLPATGDCFSVPASLNSFLPTECLILCPVPESSRPRYPGSSGHGLLRPQFRDNHAGTVQPGDDSASR